MQETSKPFNLVFFLARFTIRSMTSSRFLSVSVSFSTNNNVVETMGGNKFPCLDLALFWNERNELNFKVHVKENQHLKCLNSDSTHVKSCLKAVSHRIFGRLAKPTSVLRKNSVLQLMNCVPITLKHWKLQELHLRDTLD